MTHDFTTILWPLQHWSVPEGIHQWLRKVILGLIIHQATAEDGDMGIDYLPGSLSLSGLLWRNVNESIHLFLELTTLEQRNGWRETWRWGDCLCAERFHCFTFFSSHLKYVYACKCIAGICFIRWLTVTVGRFAEEGEGGCWTWLSICSISELDCNSVKVWDGKQNWTKKWDMLQSIFFSNTGLIVRI